MNLPSAATISLIPPFEGVKAIALDTCDPWTQNTMGELISAQEKKGLPSFIAIAKDQLGHIYPYDAQQFVRARFKHFQKKSPLTVSPIDKGRIYRIEKLAGPAMMLCEIDQVRENHDHFIKMIYAADQNEDVNLKWRGDDRYYTALVYEEQGKIKEAKKWLKLGAKDGSEKAHFKLYDFYLRKGKPQKALYHLRSAYEREEDFEIKAMMQSLLDEMTAGQNNP